MYADYAKVTEDGIFGFYGNYRFLSNFFPAEITWENITYPSTEHAYQAAKTLELDTRKLIAVHPIKGLKSVGKKVILRHDWEKEVQGIPVKKRIMKEINLLKYTAHPHLRISLLSTHPKYLEETNHWNDKIWGVCCKTGIGTNWLGKTLMEIREELHINPKPCS